MTILILGGTGYLGSRVIRSFLKKGIQVICLKRKTSSLERLSRGEQQEGLLFCDIDDMHTFLNQWNEIKIDWFLNMSCCYCKKGIPDMAIWQANFIVPLECMLAAMEFGVKRFITIDTGLPSDLNIYCMAKEEFAKAGRFYAQEKKLEFQNILLELYYGEDEPENRFLPTVLRLLRHNEDVPLTEGLQKRDFIYVGDVVDNLVNIVMRPFTPEYRDVPMGSGEGPTIREVVSYLQEQTGSSSELRFGAVPGRKNEPDSIADAEKMKEYGICSKHSWKEGMLCLLKQNEKEQNI